MSQTITQPVRAVTDDEVAHFVEHGWAMLRGFVSPGTTAELLDAARRLIPDAGAQQPEHVEGTPQWRDHAGAGLRGVEPVAGVVCSDEIGEAAWRLGVRRGTGVRFWLDVLTCREPAALGRHTESTIAHQDKVPFDRIGYVSFWIALDEVPPERGSMRFYSGSHREGPLGNVFGPEIFTTYPWLRERCPLSEPLHLHPGDATVHTHLTVHEAPANTTDAERWALTAVYFPEDARYAQHPHFDRLFAETLGKPIKPDRLFNRSEFPVVFRPPVAPVESS